jgi:hypothetical protein
MSMMGHYVLGEEILGQGEIGYGPHIITDRQTEVV